MGKVDVTFKINSKTNFGDNVAIVGSFQEWNAGNAAVLTTDAGSYPSWSTKIPIDPGVIEYKYVIKNGGNVQWEHFKQNRSIAVPDSVESLLVDDGSFNSFKSHGGPLASGGLKPVENGNLSAPHAPSPAYSPTPVPELGKYAATNEEQFAEAIAKENWDAKSWRQKLEFIRNFLSGTDPRFTADLGHLVYVSIYLQFLANNQIQCQEDGRHFRPNHAAEQARVIDESLVKIGMEHPELKFVMRRIYPLVPSYSAAFTCAVPLTRIRDIAHRNDIPIDLKQTIKHQLQNKLHRCAGPEDLVKAKEVLDQITGHGANYSWAFVEEYKKFYQELLEFFNARGLDDRLNELVDKGELQGDNIKLKDQFMEAKWGNCDRLDVLKRLTALRALLAGKVEAANEKGEAGETVQRVRLAETKLEEYGFVVMSELINNIEHDHNAPWIRILEALAQTTENVGLSGVKPAECAAIKKEIESFYSLQNELNDAGKPELLRLKASAERARRVAEAYSELVCELYYSRVGVLGNKLGVDGHAVRVFCESLVRSNVVFQLAKLIAIVLRKIRAIGQLPPWNPLVSGVAVGRLARFTNMEQVEKALNGDGKSDQIVVLLKKAEGDEEIPKRVAGVILAHELPHLSHLGVRSRQEGCVFVCVDDSDFLGKLSDQLGSDGTTVTLTVNPDGSCSAVKGGTTPAKDPAKKTKSLQNGAAKPEATTKPADAILASKLAVLSLDSVAQNLAGAKSNGAKSLHAISVKSSGLAAFKDPPGAAVPFGSFQLSLKASGKAVEAEYETLLKEVSAAAPDAVPEIAEKLRAFVQEKIKVPDAILEDLVKLFPKDARLMTRSSANVEDLKEISGAGLYDSISNVANTKEALANGIKAVWASLWTRRATLSRRQAGLAHEKSHMAVLVQQMIPAEISFVMMTTNPLTKNAKEAYMELALGLGETLASGNVAGSPYRLVVEKGSTSPSAVKTVAFCNFSNKLIPSKEAWTGGDAGYYASKDAPATEEILGLVPEVVDYVIPFSTDQSFRNKWGQRIAAIGALIEKELGGSAQDIEGAIIGDDVYIVQTRPQVMK